MVIVGMPGAGKSEVSSFFEEQGVPMFRSGDVIREEVVSRGLELVPENSEMIARKLREELGNDAPARITMEKVLRLKDRLVCIEGPRDMDELACIARLARLVLIVVRADEDTRFRRLSERAFKADPGNKVGGSRDPKSFSQFRWRDERERERGLGEVMKTKKYARYEIENDGSIVELRKKAMDVLADVRANMRAA
jgi:dephospho-CoA kinase